MSEGPIRVLLVDDHPIVLTGIRAELEKEADIVVAGEAHTGKACLDLVEKLEPGVLLLDMALPELDGLDVATRLRKTHPQVRVLVFSAYADDALVFGALKAGAAGYLLKEDAPEMIASAVRAVASGKGWFSPEIAAKVAAAVQGDTPAPVDLTSREQEALQLLTQGWDNQSIANALGISERTVRFHLRNVYDKIGVNSRTEALLWGIHQGIVETG
jgi:DNA-binding NarL/FixJ family response regulator